MFGKLTCSPLLLIYKLILVMTIDNGMQKTSFTYDMVHDL